MPPASRRSLPVRFDGESFAEDVQRASAGGRSAAEAARAEYDGSGVPLADLRRHQPHGSNAPTVYQIADRRLHG